MKTTKKLLAGTALLAAGLAFMAFRSEDPPLETVPYVDLNRYTGIWHEISAFPQRFEKGCHCTKAEYALHPEGYVEVFNSCRKNSPAGKLKSVRGKAFIEDPKTNAKLKVQFFWPFKGDYWIIDLAPDYSYAVVGAPNRKYLWVLSREPEMEPALYEEIKGRIRQKGFDVGKLQRTNQTCP